MRLRQISDFITQSLSLTNSPVALSFQDSTPAGVPLFNAAVPSSCTFWIRAEEQLFFAPAVLHENCPVGMLTMGFRLNAQVMSTLDEFVSKMCAASYLSPSEAGSIPRVSSSGAGILYGPLSLFSSTPDITLLWVNARQAMLLEESVGAICWDRTALTRSSSRSRNLSACRSSFGGRLVWGFKAAT